MRRLADTGLGALRRFLLLRAAQLSDVGLAFVMSGTVAAVLVVVEMMFGRAPSQPVTMSIRDSIVM